MEQGSRLFRVFVSSTFRDMLAERTVLQARVFPRLEQYCRERGARFQAVDLRWGVSEAAGHERLTMNICIEEVRRCREMSPGVSFIALLGERYGWRPLPTTVDAGDFTAMLDALPPGDRDTLQAAYHLDENARPPRQVLAPRDAADPRAAAADEAIRAIVSRAVEHAFPVGDPRRVDYDASATHIEIAEGVLRAGPGGALCYVKDGSGSASLEGPAAQSALQALKAELRAFLPAGAIVDYALEAGSVEASVDALATRIEGDLRARIDAALDRAAAITDVEREASAHASFGRRRAAHFTGRRELLDRIAAYLGEPSRAPLVVSGPGGAGKSSLLAAARAALGGSGGAGLIVARFAGATPGSSTVEGLLAGLCREIDAALGRTAPVPAEYEALKAAFASRLALASPDRPLVAFIDALDQLEATASGEPLDWLPNELPPHAKIVASVLDDSRALDAARARLGSEAILAVGPLPVADAEQLLDAWLSDAKRALRPEQRGEILRAFAGSPWPLYLRVAFDEARRWRSFDPTPRLAPEIDGLLRQHFARLESAGHHGVALVRSALRYLGTARHGLTEEELVALLSRDAEVFAEFRSRSPSSPAVDVLPLVVWSRLRADLSAYLAERGTDDAALLAFYHRAVSETVHALHLDAGAQQRAHRHLAEYFSSADQPHVFGAVVDGAPNRRKLAELPFHQALGGLLDEGRATLSDLTFIEAKCRAGMSGDLIADFDRQTRAVRSVRPLDDSDRELELLRRFALKERANFDAFAAIPGLVFQQARNDADDGAPVRAWERAPAAWRGDRWLALVNRPRATELLVAMLSRHVKGVTDCAFAARADLLVSCGMDGAIHLWNTTDWSHRALVARLPADANSCDISADGSRIVSACEDGRVRIHDRNGGAPIVCEGKYELSARRCRFLRGEAQILSVGYRGFKIHDAPTGRLVREATDRVLFDASVGPGSLAGMGESDETASVLDTATGESQQELRIDNLSRIASAIFSPDGRWFLAAGGTYRKVDDMVPFGASSLWDATTWEEVDGHERRYTSQATNAAFIADGKLYAIGFADGELALFDTASGARAGGVKGHHSSVRGLALSPDGRHLVTGSFDNHLKVWDVGALATTNAEAAKPSSARFCALSGDGARGWVWSTHVDRFRCDFTERTIAWSIDAASVGDRKALSWSRALIDLAFERRDPPHPMQATALSLRGLPPAPGNRTSPFAGDGEYWFIHASARMWPSEYRLLPALAKGRQRSSNRTWVRSVDGSLSVVLRGPLERRDGALRRTAALDLYDGDEVDPRGSLVWQFDDTRELGHCACSRDGRALWFIAGPDVCEALLERRQKGGGFTGDGASLSALAESPDGATLVAAREDGAWCAWDVRSRALTAAVAGHTGPIVDCAFLSDEDLVTIGDDATLRVWRLGASRPRAVFIADVALTTLATHRATRRILTADAQDRVYLLQLQGGR